MPTPDPMGATFAERAAAAKGVKTFAAPPADLPEKSENSTFADRAKAAKKTSSKAVDEDTDGAENKAVAKKTAAKKS